MENLGGCMLSGLGSIMSQELEKAGPYTSIDQTPALAFTLCCLSPCLRMVKLVDVFLLWNQIGVSLLVFLIYQRP